ncbi:MAG: hypothetical protein JNL01_00440 [Bdellovibrionales bacterium]|nr:hypothetical protein [Bdellovibrionales bacterium]
MPIIESLLRLPYHLSLQTLKLTLPAQVWARNSFQLGTDNPGQSDLDLTLFLEESPSDADLNRIRSSLIWAKRMAPWVGEANLYVWKKDSSWLKHANFYELGRDPKLLKKVRFESAPIATPEDALVFLIRMADADCKNLIKNPASREKKWRSHFLATGIEPMSAAELSEKRLKGVISKILSLGVSHSDPYWVQNVSDLIQSRYDHAKYPPLPESVALFPHKIGFLANRIRELSPQLKRVLIAQVRWELWGLTGQRRIRKLENLAEHMKNLKHAIQCARPENEAHWISEIDRWISAETNQEN